jgi:hypothetical protein
MVQLEKLSFLISLSVISVILVVYIFIFTLNHNYVVGITEKSINATSTLEPYNNSKVGVSIEHPTDWKVVNIKNGFQIVKEDDVVYVEIRRNNLDSSNANLEQYVDDDIKDRSSSREQFELLKKTQSTISGNLPAYKALYTFLKTKNQKDFSAQGKTDKILRIWTFSEGSAYKIAYVSEEDKYDQYLPTAEKIIKSFKIKGSEKGAEVKSAKGGAGAATSIPKSENNTLEEINRKYLKQAGPENVSSAATNESVMTAGGTGEASPNQGNVIEPSEAGYQTYENSTLGIKMQYPSNWKVEGFADRVRFVSPKEDTNDKYVQTIDLFTYPSMSLNQAVESLTNYYKTSLTNFTITGSPHASVGANSSSVSFFYTYNDNNTGPVRSMDFIVSPEASRKTYLFTFRDGDSKFQSDLPEAQKITDSIKFLK